MDINLIPQVLSRLQCAGLTQSEIAEAVGCSQSTISDMMTGKSGLTRPSYKIISGLEALAQKRNLMPPAIRRATDTEPAQSAPAARHRPSSE